MLATLAPSLKPSVRRAPANPAARIEPQSMRDTSGERGISEAALHTATHSRYPYRIQYAQAHTHTNSSLTPTQQPHTTMAGTNPIPNAHGGHPIRIPPVRPLYRVAARGLGASMWFFVRSS